VEVVKAKAKIFYYFHIPDLKATFLLGTNRRDFSLILGKIAEPINH